MGSSLESKQILNRIQANQAQPEQKRTLSKKTPMSATSGHGCYSACKLYICTKALLGGI